MQSDPRAALRGEPQSTREQRQSQCKHKASASRVTRRKGAKVDERVQTSIKGWNVEGKQVVGVTLLKTVTALTDLAEDLCGFSAPTQQLTTIHNSSAGGSMPSSGVQEHFHYRVPLGKQK